MTLKEKMIYFNNSTRVFFCLDPIKNRKMNNASRVVYADDEEMHHSLLAIPPTFLTQRRELSVWNLQRGGSGITPSSRNVHERTRSGGVETRPPPATFRSWSEFSAIVRAIGTNFLFGKPINSGSLLRGQKG